MHPIRFDVPYEIERNRLTVLLRPLIALPWIIWAYLYGIAAIVAVFIAWFALLFTKRYPEGLYRFAAGWLRLQARVGGFVALATDRIPPFGSGPDPDYPIEVEVAGPQPEYSRARTFFKLITYFPQYLILSGIGGILLAGAFVSWFRIVFTGKQSITMHEALRAGLAYNIRSTGFMLLLTEAHPRLLELPPQEPPPGAPALPRSTTAPATP